MSRWLTNIRRLRRTKSCAILVFAVLSASVQARAEAPRQPEYFSFTKSWEGKRAVRVHVFIAPLEYGIEIRPALARGAVGRLQRTSVIAEENGALAAVNGSFYNRNLPYVPVGILVMDGKILTKSLLERTAVGITGSNEVVFGIPKFTGHIVNNANGEIIPIWGINRPRKDNEAIVYTPEYGQTTKTNKNGVELIIEDDMVVGISEGASPIPENGYVISFHGWTKNFANDLPPGAFLTATYKLADDWDKYEHVLTGGPRLIKEGNVVVRASLYSENFGQDVLGRNARTAVGITSDNELLMVVIEGRQFRSRRTPRRGATYTELALLMKDLGAVEAMGLDGGGSSSMYVKGRGAVSSPSEGSEQAVSNILMVRQKPLR